MPQTRLSIVMSGMIAADPHQGGATWAVLQYVLGLRQLGHNVVLVEPVTAVHLRPAGAPLADSLNASYFRLVVAEFGLEESAAFLLDGTRETVGLSYPELLNVCRRADVLLNISGMLTDPELMGRVPVSVYLDLDPAFIQFWHAQGIDMRFAGHTHFVTIGLAIGQPDCTVPTGGRSWIPIVQPIVLEHWPVADRITHNALTTVGNWRGYGSVEHQGVFYGQKAHSLRRLIGLPRRTPEKFRLAMSIHSGEVNDLAALATNGWELLDPEDVAHSPAAYRDFVRGSKAEFGVAKSGYVDSRCGWFSDRSLCYLASGRPVIAQDTGFGPFLPTGEGLFSFQSEDEALAAIDEMNADYPRHSRAARTLAEEHFASDKVITRLLAALGVAP